MSIRSLALCALLAAGTLTAKAQKLPDTQETGLRAPAGIKVDGKATEWAGGYQAYNKNNQLYYSIANDDENVYLTVNAANTSIISKIMRGGLTFTVVTSGKKKDKTGQPSFTFPVQASTSVNTAAMQGLRTAMPAQAASMSPQEMMKRMDSVMYAMNRQHIDKLKDIKVLGVPGITDSLLSIYNEEGIKARALFDAKGAYNYELAIPLKYLGLNAGESRELQYNLCLNGLMANIRRVEGTLPSGGASEVRTVVVNGGAGGGMMSMSGPGGIDFMSLISPTDFWGKFTLVGK